jgi:hypothetical protein
MWKNMLMAQRRFRIVCLYLVKVTEPGDIRLLMKQK